MRILGLDASTTTIGWSILETTGEGKEDIRLITSGWWKPPKDGDIFSRLLTTKHFILKLLETHHPDKVVLEDIIFFMKGHSTAKTISSLAILNRTVGLTVLEALGESPELLNVMSVRHALKEAKVLPAKEEIPKRLEALLNISFPWTIKKNKKTGVDKIQSESYDEADGIAVALAWWRRRTK